MTKFRSVPVRELRQTTDHLLRLVNSAYHACIGADELAYWKQGTEGVLATLLEIDSPRATEDDKAEKAKAIERARERLAQAAEAIQKASGRQSFRPIAVTIH